MEWPLENFVIGWPIPSVMSTHSCAERPFASRNSGTIEKICNQWKVDNGVTIREPKVTIFRKIMLLYCTGYGYQILKFSVIPKVLLLWYVSHSNHILHIHKVSSIPLGTSKGPLFNLVFGADFLCPLWTKSELFLDFWYGSFWILSCMAHCLYVLPAPFGLVVCGETTADFGSGYLSVAAS